MSVVKADRGICDDGEFQMPDLEVPTTRSNVEARRHRCQLNYTIVRVMLVVAQYCHELTKKSVDIFFGVQILPVFQS